MDLKSARHVFITGGASGIGLGLAEAFAARGVGVTIADANREALNRALAENPDKLRRIHFDVRDRKGWAAAKTDAEAALGPVDILVNNAGVGPNGYEFADMDPDSFDLIIAINLTGVFNGVSCFAADMRSRGRGHIVNTSSMAGITSGMRGSGAYAASKFAIVGLSEILRKELEPHGVGVSVFCPGMIATSIMENTMKMGVDFSAEAMMKDIQAGDMQEAMRAIMASAGAPAEAAERVFKGIEENAPFIVTQAADWRPLVEKRLQVLEQTFAQAQKG
jgi:NAD(P)-dependent dehydrogenase (short-subunit alcohol dehydrogenase family)